MEKIKALIKDRKFEEADKVVDDLLSLISSPGKK
jgi:pentatricopeptide repeat protein